MKYKFIKVLPIFLLTLTACNKVPSSMEFELVDLPDKVDFHSELQLKYINSEDYTSTSGIASGSSDKSAPEAIRLSWEIKSDGNVEPKEYEVTINEKDKNESFTISSNNKYIDIYNLKINQAYSYNVKAIYDDRSFVSADKAFITTDKGPRNLKVENVMNIRDLGGYGLKQGLIYRSARLSESDGSSNLTEESKKVLNNDLKIKTEIDLRRYDENGEITTSPIGENTNYIHLPMVFGGNNILIYKGTYSGKEYNNVEQIKNYFNILADEKSYPIDFHCSIGKDRTGCLAYLTEALCGVKEEYLYRDYLFSNFAKIGGMCEMKDIDDKYGQTLNNYNGENIQEKTYNYLNEVVGVSKENLDKVISILKA